ncbi:MAG: thiamine-monophosphate kinase [Methylobacterium sp.]|nr:MAG: thiamine-monophosphate kinase [Methylobacterium sp.]
MTVFGGALLGGDTVRAAGPLMVGVTAIGEVPAGTMVRRMTAAIGDVLCVSGTIGDAALGLPFRRSPLPDWGDAIGEDACATLVDRYWHPRPRLGLAPILRHHARAAMDISDGLAGDLAKMLKGEGRSALIRLGDVPLSPAAARAVAQAPNLMDTVLTGGDDYEILCAVAPENLAVICAAAAAAGIPLHPIGTVTGGDAPPAFEASDGSRKTFAAASFSHF